VVAPAAAFASFACGWAAGGVVTHVAPTGCGTAAASPWHSVLLKHPGGVPAGAGVAGWFAGLFADPGKWHCAQTGAFAVSVFACVYTPPCHGLGACGAVVWQVKHVDPPRTVRKSAPWQIWQEANPELPGAFFAETPCCCAAGEAVTQVAATGPWWHPAGLPKQEAPEIPPERSGPWHSVQPLPPPLAM